MSEAEKAANKYVKEWVTERFGAGHGFINAKTAQMYNDFREGAAWALNRAAGICDKERKRMGRPGGTSCLSETRNSGRQDCARDLTKAIRALDKPSEGRG